MHRPLLVLAPLLLTAGCYKSWVELNPAVTADAPRPALLVSSAVVVMREEEGMADALVSMSDNADLQKMGPTLADSVAAWLKPRGFDLVVDANRAQSIQTLDLGEVANDVAVLTGAWFDPRASTRTLDNRTINRRGYTQKLAEKLDDPAVQDAYLFVVANVVMKSPGVVMKRPAMDVSLLIVDEAGEDLLRARGWGFGDPKPFVMRTDAENLGVALADAVANLEVAPVEPTREAKE